jgi:hypothetical protein
MDADTRSTLAWFDLKKMTSAERNQAIGWQDTHQALEDLHEEIFGATYFVDWTLGDTCRVLGRGGTDEAEYLLTSC